MAALKLRNRIFCILYVVLLAFVCLAVFSYTTSIFYYEPSAGDSAMFQLVGKYWANGYLPYVDFFENKGPMIHFINCLGYMLTKSATGVFFIQWISFSVTLFIILKILTLGLNLRWSCMLLLLPALSFSTNTWGGDCVEEFILPLMSLSYLYMYRWLNSVVENNAKIHPSYYAFVYGLVLSFALLTRLTNALGLCAGVAVIGVWLIVKGSWKNLFQNIIAFIAGFAVLTVPFLLYFWYKGALNNMLYDSVISNFSYLQVSSESVWSFKKIAQLLIHFLDIWILLFVSMLVLILNPKRKLAGLTWLLVSLFSLSWFCSGFSFQHYGVVSLPLIAISMLEMRQIIISERNNFVKFRRSSILALLVYFLLTIFSCIHTLKFSFDNYIDNKDLRLIRNLMRDVPSNFKTSFVGYNTSVDYYLYDDIRPACRFFTTQDFGANINSDIKNQTYAAFATGNIKWVLVRGKAKLIAPILAKDYSIFKKDPLNGYILYRLKSE